MAGYTATARIGRTRTVLRAGARASRRVEARAAGGARGTAPPDGAPAGVEDLVGRPLDATFRERWGRIRDAWTQATFFLFDPDSWR